MPLKERTLGKWGKRIRTLSLLALFAMAIYAASLYSFQAERDRNLAYTAMYLDDLTVNLYKINASFDAVMYSSALARDFCNLYMLENRTLTGRTYAPLCNVISKRTTLLAACHQGTTYCNDSMVNDFMMMADNAAPLAKELKDNPPYYGIILSYQGPDYQDQNGRTIKILPG